MSPVLEIPLSLALLLGVIPGWGAAHALERRLGARLDGDSRLALSWALWLGWAQLGLMALNTVHFLNAPSVLAWLALGLALGSGRLRGAPRPELGALWPLIGLLPILAMATVPPWYRDEMTYHLALPRAFALAGGYVRPDDNIFASFPLGWESVLSGLFALGRDGEPALNPRLLGAWTAGAAALAIAGLSRSLCRDPGNATLARSFGLAFLLMPTVLEFGPSAYVEPWLVLLAVLSVRVALLSREAPAWGVAAGALAGLAASAKYPGLVVGVGVLLVVPRPARERTLLALVLVGCPFYLRNLFQRGNPFFPLAWELLGGQGWDAWRAYAYRATLQNYGYGREARDWLLLLPRLFSSRDLRAGFEGSVGLLPLLGLVGGAIGWRAPGGEGRRVALLLALGWLLFWSFTVQQTRFALVGVALLLALGAPALELVEGRARRGLVLGVLGAALLWGAGPLGELWSRQRSTAWLSGRISRDALLAELLPESYELTRDLEVLVPPEGRVWLVWTRGYTYYLDRPYKQDSVFEAWRLEVLLDEREGLADLRQGLVEGGTTHLLVNRRFFLRDGNADLRPGRTDLLAARWQAALDAGLLVPVRSWGPVALYAIAPAQ